MLESILLKNFQGLPKLRIDLSETITTLVGPSDEGKSSAIRGLRWLATNKPSGSKFIRHGKSYASVTAIFDGHKVTRKKGKQSNSYTVDGKTLKAFGSSIPPEVSDAVKLAPVHFQAQLDSPLWLCLNAGQVARELNRHISLEDIDHTLKRCSLLLSQARTRQKLLEERAGEAKEALQALAFFPILKAEWEEIYAKWTEIKAKAVEASQLREALDQVKRDKGRAKLVRQGLQRASLALSQARKTVQLQREATELRDLLNNTTSLEGELCRQREKLQEAQEKLQRALGVRCPLCRSKLNRTQKRALLEGKRKKP